MIIKIDLASPFASSSLIRGFYMARNLTKSGGGRLEKLVRNLTKCPFPSVKIEIEIEN